MYIWDVDEIAEFVTYLGEGKRWRRKYPTIIHKKKIDGEFLNNCDKYDLIKLGFERKDAKRLLYAFSTVSEQICESNDTYQHHKPRNEYEDTQSFYSIRSLSDL